jgi:hypothetical protein
MQSSNNSTENNDIEKNNIVYEEGGDIFNFSIEKRGEKIMLFCSSLDGPNMYFTVSKNDAIALKRELEKVL